MNPDFLTKIDGVLEESDRLQQRARELRAQLWEQVERAKQLLHCERQTAERETERDTEKPPS